MNQRHYFLELAVLITLLLPVAIGSFLKPYTYNQHQPPAANNMAACSKSEPGKCIPCESLDPSSLLPRERVDQQVQGDLPLWTIQETAEGNPCLSRTFVAKNFQSALDAINAMGVVAEREGHHPDFHLTSYRMVEIVVYTHSVGGVTQNDILLAQMLDREVDVVYSPKWLKEHPDATK